MVRLLAIADLLMDVATQAKAQSRYKHATIAAMHASTVVVTVHQLVSALASLMDQQSDEVQATAGRSVRAPFPGG